MELRKHDDLIKKKYKEINYDLCYQWNYLEYQVKDYYCNIVESYISVKQLYADVFETNNSNVTEKLKVFIDKKIASTTTQFNDMLDSATEYDPYLIFRDFKSDQRQYLLIKTIGVYDFKLKFKSCKQENNLKVNEMSIKSNVIDEIRLSPPLDSSIKICAIEEKNNDLPEVDKQIDQEPNDVNINNIKELKELDEYYANVVKNI
ncbi:hypothetical protein COBT_001714 [Conglomerata obtusa]